MQIFGWTLRLDWNSYCA